MFILHHRFYRFLWCLLLVGTTAWIPPQSITTWRTTHKQQDRLASSLGFFAVPYQSLVPRQHQFVFSLESHANKNDNNDEKRPSRMARWKSRIRKHCLPAIIALTVTMRTPNIALAAPIPEKQLFSLQPGISMDEAEELVEGSDVVQLQDKGATLMDSQEETANDSAARSKKAASKPKKKQETFDYGIEDEEEEFYEEDVETFGNMGRGVATGRASSSKAAAPAGPTAFAGVEPKGPDNSLYFKAFMGLIFPIFAIVIGRGVVQEWKNQQTLKKAIEIMDAQKAEYFNITASSNATDVAIEDELKDIKKNETDADDEDEDDDTPPPPRKRPKRGGPSGSGGSGSDGGDVGGGKPSDDDLDRLNKMFKKS